MDRANSMQWKVVSDKQLYADQWLDLRAADVELPDGRHLDYRFIRMAPVAGTVIIDDKRRVLLMWRHRFITGLWGWEIPMGRIEDDETPAQAAAREVEEETGWRPRQLQPLLVTQPSAGAMDSAHYIFEGTGAVQVGAPVDSYESSAIQWIPLADIPELIAKQDVHGSTTMASLLLLLLKDSRTADAAKDGPAPRF